MAGGAGAVQAGCTRAAAGVQVHVPPGGWTVLSQALADQWVCCPDFAPPPPHPHPHTHTRIRALKLTATTPTSSTASTTQLNKQTPGAPPAPPSLYRLSAQLIAADRVTLEQLLVYLSPDDDDLAARYAAAAEAVKCEVEAYGKIDLTSNEGASGGAPRGGAFTGAGLDLDASRFDDLLLQHLSQPSVGKGGGGGGGSSVGGGEGKEGKGTSAGGAATAADGGGGDSSGSAGGGGPNQKLALVEGLLAVGDWGAAKLLMQHLQVCACVLLPPLSSVGWDGIAQGGSCLLLACIIQCRVDYFNAASTTCGNRIHHLKSITLKPTHHHPKTAPGHPSSRRPRRLRRPLGPGSCPHRPHPHAAAA